MDQMRTIKRFRPYFKTLSVPDGCVGLNCIYIPGMNYNDRWRWSKDIIYRKPLYFKFNTADCTLILLEYWQQPERDVSRYVDSIIYDGGLKKGKINRTLDSIQNMKFQLKNILITAEKELNYLKHTYDILIFNESKNAPYITQVMDLFCDFHRHYVDLFLYWKDLDIIMESYHKLQTALKTKNACFECLRCPSVCGPLKQKKSKMLCT